MCLRALSCSCVRTLSNNEAGLHLERIGLTMGTCGAGMRWITRPNPLLLHCDPDRDNWDRDLKLNQDWLSLGGRKCIMVVVTIGMNKIVLELLGSRDQLLISATARKRTAWVSSKLLCVCGQGGVDPKLDRAGKGYLQGLITRLQTISTCLYFLLTGTWWGMFQAQVWTGEWVPDLQLPFVFCNQRGPQGYDVMSTRTL